MNEQINPDHLKWVIAATVFMSAFLGTLISFLIQRR